MRFIKTKVTLAIVYSLVFNYSFADQTVLEVLPDTSQYQDDVLKLSAQSNKLRLATTPRANTKGMQQESIQAVIDHTNKIRESESLSLLADTVKNNHEKVSSSGKTDVDLIGENKLDVMKGQSSNIEKMFGNYGVSSQDWERKLDSQRNDEVSSENGLTIFASFSMPEAVLKDLFQVANERNATIAFNGLKKGTKNIVETQAAFKQFILKNKITKEPNVSFEPNSFADYNILSVPVMVYRSNNKISRISGTFNIDYFFELMDKNPDIVEFPTAGKTFIVEEKSIVEELTERSQNYDWESAKKRALAETWQNQYMVSLPPSLEHKIWFIDPTIKVLHDINDRQGRILARAGELKNPLTQFPQKLTMIIFDPLKDGQVEWAVKSYRSFIGSGKILPIFTQINTSNGWEELNSLREKFDGRAFKIDEQIIKRFHIVSTPVIITTSGSKFKVEQLSIGKINEILLKPTIDNE